MNKRRHYNDGVGDEMYQLQFAVEEETAEEIPSEDVEATLKEGHEGNSSPAAVFHSTSAFSLTSPRSTRAWIFTSIIVDDTHTVRGSGIGRATAAIPRLGLDLDLKETRVWMRMHKRCRERMAALARGWLEPVADWRGLCGERTRDRGG
jgi:hypothetical protein